MALLWRATVRAAFAAERRFGSDRVRIQSYEALVESPDRVLRELADWLDLEYQAQMVEVPVVNSSYGEAFDGPGGISREPLDRWRVALPAGHVAVVQSACRSQMSELGYEQEPVRAGRVAVASRWVAFPFVLVRVALLNRGRLGNTRDYLRRRLAFAFSRT